MSQEAVALTSRFGRCWFLVLPEPQVRRLVVDAADGMSLPASSARTRSSHLPRIEFTGIRYHILQYPIWLLHDTYYCTKQDLEVRVRDVFPSLG